MMVGVVVAALAICYVGDYYRLSRRGFEEAQSIAIDGFFYVPIAEAPTRVGLSKHIDFATWYAPLNWIDRAFFGGRPPSGGVLWRLND